MDGPESTMAASSNSRLSARTNALVGVEQPQHAENAGALAGSGLADERDRLPNANLEVDTSNRLQQACTRSKRDPQPLDPKDHLRTSSSRSAHVGHRLLLPNALRRVEPVAQPITDRVHREHHQSKQEPRENCEPPRPMNELTSLRDHQT